MGLWVGVSLPATLKNRNTPALNRSGLIGGCCVIGLATITFTGNIYVQLSAGFKQEPTVDVHNGK